MKGVIVGLHDLHMDNKINFETSQFKIWQACDQKRHTFCHGKDLLYTDLPVFKVLHNSHRRVLQLPLHPIWTGSLELKFFSIANQRPVLKAFYKKVNLQAQSAQRLPPFLKVEAATLTLDMERFEQKWVFKSNLLLHNRNAWLVLGEHVIGERSTLLTQAASQQSEVLQSLKRIADEPAW